MSIYQDKKWADITLNRRDSEAARSEEPNTKGLWVAFAVLLIALVGASVYGYVSLQKQNIQLSQIPDVMASVSLMSGRMAAAEASLREMKTNWQGVQEAFAELDRKVNSRVGSARKYSEKLTAQMESRVQTRMDARATALEARIRQLQSEQQADRTHLAQLGDEVASVQAEIASVRNQTGREVNRLNRQVAATDRELMQLNEDLAADRVDFEVVKRRVHELSPGISLKVTGTDVRYQRFSGWVSYVPDGRTLWVRNQGVQQPFTFYDKQGDEMYELVVTRVNKDSAVGYLLLPTAGGSETSRAHLIGQTTEYSKRGL